MARKNDKRFNFIFENNKWHPEKWTPDYKRDIIKDLDAIRSFCGQLQRDLVHNDSFLLDDYNSLMEVVEGLYGKLELGELAQDIAKNNAEFKRRAAKDD